MGLECSCGEHDPEPGDVMWFEPDDFQQFEGIGKLKIRKRCSSCNDLIDLDSKCLIFGRIKIPEHEIEINIYGEDGEINIAPWYMCEKCGDQWFNLSSLGYCVRPYENMFDLLKEYVSQNKARMDWNNKENAKAGFRDQKKGKRHPIIRVKQPILRYQ